MQDLPVIDCPDGVSRADQGCFAMGPTAKTANFTLKASDTGQLYTNKGATGDVVATLPKPVAGVWYAFVAPVTNHSFTVTATNSAKIDGGTGNGSLVVTAGTALKLWSDGVGWYSQVSVTYSNAVLGNLPQGTDGQLIIGQTGIAPIYAALSGDATMTAAGVVTIGAGKVTVAKSKVFVSTIQTGTGSAQNVAHGLGSTPNLVLVVPYDGGTVSEGTHTSTNAVVTCTTGKLFKVMAWV